MLTQLDHVRTPRLGPGVAGLMLILFGDPMTPQEVRTRLFALHGTGRACEFVSLGWHYIAALPGDVEMAAWVMQYLLNLGLGCAARELLALAPHWRLDGEQRAKLDSMINAAPAGRVAWQDLRQQYRSNLAALLDGRPHLHELEPKIEQALSGFHLFRTTDGHYQLSKRAAGGMRQWLPFVTDFAEERAVQLPEFSGASAIILDGLSLGPLLANVVAATAEIGIHKSLPVFLVEEDLARLAAWLHTADRTTLLRSGRVFAFAGDRAQAELEDFLKGQDTIAAAAMCAITPPGLPSHYVSLREVWRRFQEHYAAQLTALRASLEDRYAARDPAYWRGRLANVDTIVGLTSRATTMLRYATRDIGRAFEELGCEFHLMMEEEDHHRLTPLRVLRKIQAVDPDLVVMVDHLRYEYNGLLFNIPVLTWIQDPLPNILCAQAGESIAALDFVCGYYQRQCCEQFGYPAENFFHAPVPVSAAMFHDQAVDSDLRQRLSCDLIYVGHLAGGVDQVRREWRSKSPPSVHPLLDRMDDEMHALLRRGAHLIVHDAEALVRQWALELDVGLALDELQRLAHFYAYRLFDIGFRMESLSWAAQWADSYGRSLKIYGRGWQDVPQLARFAMGPIEHGEPLRQAYRCASLTLQTMPGGFLHQRSYEALASGSLVLARFSPINFSVTPEEYVQRHLASEGHTCGCIEFPELEHVVFRSEEELHALAERYLQDADLRQRRWAAFRSIVLEKYSYTAVVGRVMAGIRGTGYGFHEYGGQDPGFKSGRLVVRQVGSSGR